MRLLVDTDAFCKLAIGGVLHEALRLLETDLNECGRLPALPYMLRRGRLRNAYGPQTCDGLIPLAESIPVLVAASATWLGKLSPIQTIDPGEAQILAAAAEHGMIVVSGDKRALRALKEVDDLPHRLAGRIVVLEALLIALCEDLGPAEVRRRVQPLMALDRMVRFCFSTPGGDPREGLRSYFESLATEVAPIVLWNPWSGRAT